MRFLLASSTHPTRWTVWFAVFVSGSSERSRNKLAGNSILRTLVFLIVATVIHLEAKIIKMNTLSTMKMRNNVVEAAHALINFLKKLFLLMPFAFSSFVSWRMSGGFLLESCAEADWESSHSLLCTGERSESVSREALGEFIKHANETNDIFLLAAKAISFTILRYRRLKGEHVNKKAKLSEPNRSLLLEAWKPVSLGYKIRWWDCIALPDDVDPSDEGAFRMQIKNLACTSLELLKTAIFDKECEALFSLEIYGNIIGMFELNNLDLVVASPVEDYFLYFDDLPDAEKEEAEEITKPFLYAIGDGYSDCCQGTAFFPLQSCINHSCCPNAKAFKREEDRDGQAVIFALRRISKNEEVTISYIDQELPYKERQALLADYGFSCKCSKCLEDSSSV
ncbi:PREDICTED: histone-lysine N-methyltransferase ATXR2-like [Camelina sativa]|uniref:Histone-lysine N-methyltransferase ATXR2-like n=1 Tax=Camelina sativa TaxID=90675 RepID=A0ABM1Q863_CAMSA|nr:PREDICTED: histone-lysine N-methyltransferase ATXR2-like [Camelina sativa]